MTTASILCLCVAMLSPPFCSDSLLMAPAKWVSYPNYVFNIVHHCADILNTTSILSLFLKTLLHSRKKIRKM